MSSDRDLLCEALEELAILGRCLDVDAHLERWESTADAVSGGIAADGLDQALGLLVELGAGRANVLADAVRRIAATLPPPLE